MKKLALTAVKSFKLEKIRGTTLKFVNIMPGITGTKSCKAALFGRSRTRRSVGRKRIGPRIEGVRIMGERVKRSTGSTIGKIINVGLQEELFKFCIAKS